MIVEMIKQLRATTSGPAKTDIIKQFDCIDGIREILSYTYDPTYVYNLSNKRLEECIGFQLQETCKLADEEVDFLNELVVRKISGYAAVNKAHSLMVNHGGLLYLVLTKDLRCGIGPAIINKAIPGLIPEFKVQLAKEVPKAKWKFPMAMETKYDGVRLIVKKIDDYTITIQTRNGKFVNLPELVEHFGNTRVLPGVYDGEIIIDKGISKDRTSISGRINSAIHGGLIKESDLRFMVFDYLSVNAFNRKLKTHPFALRRQHLEQIFAETNYGGYITLAKSDIVCTPTQVNDKYEELIINGFEGVILKDLYAPYEFKRSAAWIKLKEIKTADLLCLDYENGTGKYDGLIGALICSGEVEGKHVVCNVGTGLSDQDRSMSGNTYVGKTIEVKYNMVIESFNGGWTLFLPRFVTVRHDKDL